MYAYPAINITVINEAGKCLTIVAIAWHKLHLFSVTLLLTIVGTELNTKQLFLSLTYGQNIISIIISVIIS